MLPGCFVNTVRVLVPDDCADPVGFHDVLVENLSDTPDYHVRPVSAWDLASLRQRWTSSLLPAMNKRQARASGSHGCSASGL